MKSPHSGVTDLEGSLNPEPQVVDLKFQIRKDPLVSPTLPPIFKRLLLRVLFFISSSVLVFLFTSLGPRGETPPQQTNVTYFGEIAEERGPDELITEGTCECAAYDGFKYCECVGQCTAHMRERMCIDLVGEGRCAPTDHAFCDCTGYIPSPARRKHTCNASPRCKWRDSLCMFDKRTYSSGDTYTSVQDYVNAYGKDHLVTVRKQLTRVEGEEEEIIRSMFQGDAVFHFRHTVKPYRE